MPLETNIKFCHGINLLYFEYLHYKLKCTYNLQLTRVKGQTCTSNGYDESSILQNALAVALKIITKHKLSKMGSSILFFIHFCTNINTLHHLA